MKTSIKADFLSTPGRPSDLSTRPTLDSIHFATEQLFCRSCSEIFCQSPDSFSCLFDQPDDRFYELTIQNTVNLGKLLEELQETIPPVCAGQIAQIRAKQVSIGDITSKLQARRKLPGLSVAI